MGCNFARFWKKMITFLNFFVKFCQNLTRAWRTESKKKHHCCEFFSKLLLIFFPNLEETGKLFTKYSNSHAISVVILQQSALCSQQNRLSFCAILTKFCKFWNLFNKTLTKFYTSFWNSKLKWTRPTQTVFQNFC